MRSSKSRSRNKNRNNRPTATNLINRVFDSSGPDGKVRGTPQQIIEKYNQMHRDAQLSGDRVAAENYAQHAEHYLRLLAEAQQEADRIRLEQEERNRERQAERDRERQERLKAQEAAAAMASVETEDVPTSSEVVESDASDGQSTKLVETPEGEPVKKARTPRQRRPRQPRKKVNSEIGDTPESEIKPAPESEKPSEVSSLEIVDVMDAQS